MTPFGNQCIPLQTQNVSVATLVRTCGLVRKTCWQFDDEGERNGSLVTQIVQCWL